VLCGCLEEESEHHRNFIESSVPMILHVDRYLSDTEIRAYYETADFVILPYTTDFSGSSGVLASAASAGTPVITTNHGLIAYRVKKYGLGFTYPSGNVKALAKLVESLPARDSQQYKQLRQRCLEFAKENSINIFCDILRETAKSNHEQ
jgi:glycosyltransferase involved in cell wall biosynthesis